MNMHQNPPQLPLWKKFFLGIKLGLVLLRVVFWLLVDVVVWIIKSIFRIIRFCVVRVWNFFFARWFPVCVYCYRFGSHDDPVVKQPCCRKWMHEECHCKATIDKLIGLAEDAYVMNLMGGEE